MSKPVQLTLDRGVLWFEDGTEVSNVSEELLKAAPDLLKACKKSAERIDYLCGMVNSYSYQLGLGRKVHAEDWMDEAVDAVAKASKQ